MRVILDSHLRTPTGARLFKTRPPSPVLIFCCTDAPETRRRVLEAQGAEIVEIPSPGNRLDLRAVLRELGSRDVLGLLVEGGSGVHWSFLANSLVDCFYFIIAPVVLGGRDAVPSVGGEGYAAIADSPKFKIRRTFSAGPDVILETYPSYSRSIISPWLSRENAASGEQGFSPSL